VECPPADILHTSRGQISERGKDRANPSGTAVHHTRCTILTAGLGVTQDQGREYFQILPKPVENPIAPDFVAKGIVLLQAQKRLVSGNSCSGGWPGARESTRVTFWVCDLHSARQLCLRTGFGWFEPTPDDSAFPVHRDAIRRKRIPNMSRHFRLICVDLQIVFQHMEQCVPEPHRRVARKSRLASRCGAATAASPLRLRTSRRGRRAPGISSARRFEDRQKVCVKINKRTVVIRQLPKHVLELVLKFAGKGYLIRRSMLSKATSSSASDRGAQVAGPVVLPSALRLQQPVQRQQELECRQLAAALPA